MAKNRRKALAAGVGIGLATLAATYGISKAAAAAPPPEAPPPEEEEEVPTELRGLPKPNQVSLFEGVDYPDPTVAGVSRLLETLPEPTPPLPLEAPPPPILIDEVLQEGYKSFIIDLSVVHTDQKLGVRDLGVIGDAWSCKRADASFDLRLNDVAEDLIPNVQRGDAMDKFQIKELYVTNVAAPPGSQALIILTWKPRTRAS